MKIVYGTKETNIDVTDICLKRLTRYDNIIHIPHQDRTRDAMFSDPLLGIKKNIVITIDNTEYEYSDSYAIQVNSDTGNIAVFNYDSIENKLSQIHSNLKIVHGGFHEELPEQRMAARFLHGDEKVLEIGANIGRNSLVIGIGSSRFAGCS